MYTINLLSLSNTNGREISYGLVLLSTPHKIGLKRGIFHVMTVNGNGVAVVVIFIVRCNITSLQGSPIPKKLLKTENYHNIACWAYKPLQNS